MDDIKINGKAIYTTKGAAREYGRVGCNFYTGCPHECSYCYLKRGAPGKLLGGSVVRLKKCFRDEDDALEVFRKEEEKHIDVLRKTGVFFSFTTDPMLKETCMLTMKAARIAVDEGIPVKILTKCSRALMSAVLLINDVPDDRRRLLSFGFTLTGRDDMEPHADKNNERIESMRGLKEQGFKTWASIEPVIDWTSTWLVVDMSVDCCDHYKIGLRSGVKKDYYDLAESGRELDDLTRMITDFEGRTVYLKESARRLLRRCYREDYYNRILSRTVDMDGNPINLNE